MSKANDTPDNKLRMQHRANNRFYNRCQHQEGKTLEGNVFRCKRCGKAVGFMRLPR
jgi:hypothetical protein